MTTETKHPTLNRILVEGVSKPIPPKEQWVVVQEWYEYLEKERDGDRPVINALNEAWDSLNELYTFNGESCIERGAELSRNSSSPLAALFYFIDMGFYPPPELLLCLNDCWGRYMSGGGYTSLEEAFFGRTVQKAGNYAKRSGSKMKKFAITMEFAKCMREGKTRQQSAEIVSELFGGKPDADSILRQLRNFSGFGKAALTEKKG